MKNSNETIFSSSHRNIWVNLILPMLSKKDAWHVAGTCKNARKFALEHLKKEFPYEDLLWSQEYHTKQITRLSKYKFGYYDLLFSTRWTESFGHILTDVLRSLLAFASVPSFLIFAVANQSLITEPENLELQKTNDGMKNLTTILTAACALLSLIVIKLNYGFWNKDNEGIDQEMAHDKKQLQIAINRRHTLFPEKEPKSIISTISEHCTIF